ncbi:hypothetical protein ACJ41O_003693 [Fusarium nematophilum]
MDAECTCHIVNTYIGLDFGATYSAISVARKPDCRRHPRDAERFASTPYLINVPTALRKNPASGRPEFFDAPGVEEYGTQYLRYFKMALMRRDEWFSGFEDPEILSAITSNFDQQFSNYMSSPEVVAIYLQGLLLKGISSVLDPHGGHRHIGISWPACWSSQQSKPLEKLKEAVRLAGIPRSADQVTYITEHEASAYAMLFDHRDILQVRAPNSYAVDHASHPEWAALPLSEPSRHPVPSTAFSLQETDSVLFQAGESVLVADCGGITIHELQAESRLTGAVAGDLAFRRHIVRKIEEITGIRESDFPADTQQAVAAAMTRWHKDIKNHVDLTRMAFNDDHFLVHGGDVIVSRQV